MLKNNILTIHQKILKEEFNILFSERKQILMKEHLLYGNFSSN
jgi:hypothetical protein